MDRKEPERIYCEWCGAFTPNGRCPHCDPDDDAEPRKEQKQPEINRVQETLIQQLQAQNPLFTAEFNISSIVLMDENRVRLCSRGGEVVNIDIAYNEGSDLYDIKAYRIRNHGLDVKTIYDKTGFYWDQLNEAIKTILKRKGG